MSFDSFAGRWRDQLPISESGNYVADHKARIAQERQQELERKQEEILELTSGRNSPAQRVVIWERRHGLTLPLDSNHPALGIIAAATGLALEQMHEEQRRRSARAETEAETNGTAAIAHP